MKQTFTTHKPQGTVESASAAFTRLRPERGCISPKRRLKDSFIKRGGGQNSAGAKQQPIVAEPSGPCTLRPAPGIHHPVADAQWLQGLFCSKSTKKKTKKKKKKKAANRGLTPSSPPAGGLTVRHPIPVNVL